MINITVKDIIKATNGFLLCGDENIVLNDICIDSRKVKEGDLFVPLIGENVDAHRFIESAMETGTATLTAQHDNVVISDKPYIRVDDTEKALQDIGLYIRNRYHMPVVGVTGSVGKTTTREMITAAISTAKKCFHTEGNYNSQIGVPITLSKMTDEYEAAVIEMGIGKPGEMKLLSSMVQPDIAVVTVIGVAHIEYLKTQENIRQEKLDIISNMSENGLLIINGDDPLLKEIKNSMPCRTMTYGCDEECDFRAENIRFEDNYTVYDMVYKNQKTTVKLNVRGKHNVRNSLAGMAVAYEMGIPFEISSKAYENFQGQRQRIIKLENRYTIFDDSYNASPDSMKASIDVLCDMECKGKKYAVLGDMFELGEKSLEYHRQIGAYLCDKKIDGVIVIGEHAQEIKKVLDACENKYATTYAFEDNEEIAMTLMGMLSPDDIVLVKGSNGMNLKEIVNILSN
ncbi:MAG: UDP-N-acetylmuramoyl-tripeptide--D-alanyl-D-alanine ligase [Coprococcus sp.]